ncbi:MAG: apolipoprotein N-acyltransferase [Verrucomicrobia bacterium]|nr:apolipoprotein N-acyltransferase [Verrucomicrobiota bacterium]
MKTALYILISFLLVAFGQPAFSSFCSLVAASLGYALIWKALTPLPSKKHRFYAATAWFFAVQLVQLSWMTSIEFQGLYILGVYAGLSLGLGLQFGLLSQWVDRFPHIAVAALWTIFEWVRLFLLSGFTWNPVGLSLTASIYSLQMASIWGVLGLSYWVILTNLAFWNKKYYAWGALTLVPYLFGVVQMSYRGPELDKSPRLSIALIQTGLLPSQKVPLQGRLEEFVSPYAQWEQILSLLQPVHEPLDLIVLPEYAVPVVAELPLYRGEAVQKIFEQKLGSVSEAIAGKVSNLFWMHKLANHFSAEVVAGLDAQEGNQFFSSAFHVQPTTLSETRYDKQILMPLAEYLPFTWLKTFTAAYGITSFFTPGRETKIFPSKVPFAVSICYEETFGHLMQHARQKGAELFINLTNDGWYPGTLLPQEHFDHGRVRAVENGIPLVRACNTGVTAGVDSLGHVIGSLPDQTAAVLTLHVPTYKYFTLYSWWGNIGILTICFFSLALLVRNIKIR